MQREERGPGVSGGWGDMYRQEKGQRKGEGDDGDDEDDGDDGNGKDEGGESVSGRRVVNFGEGVRRGVDARGGGYGAPQDLN